jgi:biopolymer transport protein ExbD
MKFRNTGGDAEKIETQMAPLIDVVFLLLIFFLLTLKIIEPEGEFNINMPVGTPTVVQNQDQIIPDIKVRLIADANGSMQQLLLNRRSLGSGEAAFERLNDDIRQIVVGRQGKQDVEVEIDADYHLNHEYTLRAISACTGRINPQSKQIERYVEKIKFAPPRRPVAAGG